ncbi:efflux RND transporter periplasmic adaptor subunit [Thalassotalea sp. G2M2-11]|uniref:efflux RND transporter periplasmic adaptor subunit n=1 Tax=Thalassotalea sp. G2M2-11 TaxID=2787627 RepID=UPI0019D23E21|nr:efflux RND transporter periplasmic adaptor subunit [Thalassotalea sp. G2M2-11]
MKHILCYFFLSITCTSFLASAQNYEIAQVSVSPYEKSFTRAGKVAFKRTANLSFKSSGYLDELSADEGDFFSSKQRLASLNTEELKALKNTRYIALLQAKKDRKRIQQLLAKKLTTEQALELAQTKVETQREAYQIAYYNLEKAEIYAPFNGVVLARHAELAEFQTPGKPILTVAAIDNNLVVKVSLTSREVVFVKQGQEVKVRLPNLGQVDGVISKVPVISNTAGQLYLIEVLLKSMSAGGGVVAGQLAQVEIDVASDKLVYKVPLSALIEIDELGNAILLTKVSDERFIHQSFTVLNMDNQFLYLNANSQNDTLDVVTTGWQQLKVSE